MRPWHAIKPKFAQLVADEGPKVVANAIPAAVTTVYRLINGETRQPSGAVLANIERLVDGNNHEHDKQPDRT